MKTKLGILGLVAAVLFGGSSASLAEDGLEVRPPPVLDRAQDQIQIQRGPLAVELKELWLNYRVQFRAMLEERQQLIQRYHLATREGKVAMRKQLREHQKTIAETHRLLRRQIRDQVREIRDERRRRMPCHGG